MGFWNSRNHCWFDSSQVPWNNGGTCTVDDTVTLWLYILICLHHNIFISRYPLLKNSTRETSENICYGILFDPVSLLLHILSFSLSYQSNHLHSQNLKGGFSLHLCFSCQSPPKTPPWPISKPGSSLTSNCQSSSRKQSQCWPTVNCWLSCF